MEYNTDNNDDINDTKTFSITGTNNRYQMKKVKKEVKTIKKRVESEGWNIPEEYLLYKKQFETVQNIITNNYTHYDDESKLIIQQIERKKLSYKHQDIEKKIYNENKFIQLKNILDKIIESDLKCYYCNCEMYLLYEIVRESKQWTIDRIDNDLGHNNDNFVLSCLDCNLKRRRRTTEKFLFTKQLNIIKKD